MTLLEADVGAVVFVGSILDDDVAIGWVLEAERSTCVKVEVAPGSAEFVGEVRVVHPLSIIGLFLAVNPADCQILSSSAADLAGNDLIVE